jgi:hypothetical protein
MSGEKWILSPEGFWIQSDEPEFVGEFPTRKELKCTKTQKTAGFSLKHFNSGAVAKLPEGFPFDLDQAEWTVEQSEVFARVWDHRIEHRLRQFGDLAVGDALIIQSLVGVHIGVVKEIDAKESSAWATTPSDKMGFTLNFAKDGDDCWSCSSAFNLKALKRLEIFSGDNKDD